MRRLLLLALLAFPACAVAQTQIFKFPKVVTKDYASGFCAAWAIAVAASAQNVRHYQSMLRDATNGTTYADQAARIVLSGLDDYVVLPPMEDGMVWNGDRGHKAYKCRELNR